MKALERIKLLLEELWEEVDYEESEITEETWILDDTPFNEETDLEERTITVIRNGKRVRVKIKRKRKRVISGKEKAARRRGARKLKRTLKRADVKRKRKMSLRKRKASGLKKTKGRKNLRITK